MPITQTYINTIVEKGKEFVVTAMADYYDCRSKGLDAKYRWIEIGCLAAFVKILSEYIVGGSGFCINNTQAEQIAENIKDIMVRLSNKPLTFETFYLLQESGDALLMEDGNNLIWI